MDLEFTGIRLTQGDVNLRQISALPADTQLTEIENKIVQPSETLGKAHKFAPEAANVTVLDAQQTPAGGTITPNTHKFVVVSSEGALMFHGKEFETSPNTDTATDHSALTVPPGVYYVDIAREYDYDRMESARVVD